MPKTNKERKLTEVKKDYQELVQLRDRLPSIITNIKREISTLEQTIVDKTREKLSLESRVSSKQRELSGKPGLLLMQKDRLRQKVIFLEESKQSFQLYSARYNLSQKLFKVLKAESSKIDSVSHILREEFLSLIVKSISREDKFVN